MSSAQEVLARFQEKGIPRGKGSLYFKPMDALELVEACRRESVAVIGLEGFRVDGTYIMPDIIVDLSNPSPASWHAYVAECADKVAEALQGVINWRDYIVEAVLED